jgi:hypothetical protein
MDIKSLDLNLLVALGALLSELNVTKAARRLLRVIFDDPLLLPWNALSSIFAGWARS